jgi:hypothetical protein
MAEVLGYTRGFVTQMTSPAYDAAIPARHVVKIMKLSGLQPREQRMFLDTYLDAHPDKISELFGLEDGQASRTLSVEVPVLSSPAAQGRLEMLITTMAREIFDAMVKIDEDLRSPSEQAQDRRSIA